MLQGEGRAALSSHILTPTPALRVVSVFLRLSPKTFELELDRHERAAANLLERHQLGDEEKRRREIGREIVAMAPKSSFASPCPDGDEASRGSKEVNVSEQILLRAICWDTKFKNKPIEEVEEVMAQVTHLKLHGLSPALTRVDDLKRFKALSSLYLYDNKISYLGSLAPCKALTHLYLQNNELESTEMIQVRPHDTPTRPRARAGENLLFLFFFADASLPTCRAFPT